LLTPELFKSRPTKPAYCQKLQVRRAVGIQRSGCKNGVGWQIAFASKPAPTLD